MFFIVAFRFWIARSDFISSYWLYDICDAVDHLFVRSEFNASTSRCFSGILCSGIAGGDLPLIRLCRRFNEFTGHVVYNLPLGYIFSIGLWSKPLIKIKPFEVVRINKSCDETTTI